MIRQGDVLLKRVNRIPEELKARTDKTVALGEATGHHHTFNGQALVFGERGKQQFAKLKQECVLEHQEHEKVTVPKGLYEVVIQREVDLLGEVRRVMD